VAVNAPAKPIWPVQVAVPGSAGNSPDGRLVDCHLVCVALRFSLSPQHAELEAFVKQLLDSRGFYTANSADPDQLFAEERRLLEGAPHPAGWCSLPEYAGRSSKTCHNWNASPWGDWAAGRRVGLIPRMR